MKKILWILLFALLTLSSCVEQLQDESTLRVAGVWAYTDPDSKEVTSILEFHNGLFIERASVGDCYYADGCIYGADIESLKGKKFEYEYSLIDGKLKYGKNEYEISVIKNELTFRDKKYYLVERWEPEAVFTLRHDASVNKDNVLLLSYDEQECVINYWYDKINIDPNVTVKKIDQADWLTVKEVGDGKVVFLIEKNTTINNRTCDVRLQAPESYVEFNITQRGEPALSFGSGGVVDCDFRAGTPTLRMTLHNPIEGETLQFSCNKSWVRNIKYVKDRPPFYLSLDVSENNTRNEREALITIKYNNNTTTVPVVQSGVIDLSASGTSNCYVVNDIGDHKFRATQGNSSESVGQIKSVEVLWESYYDDGTKTQNDKFIEYVSLYSDYIVINTGKDNNANAVVAAKDSKGNVLWSWHIWATSDIKGHTYYSGNVLMDRNLGACMKETGLYDAGMLYQWGRKDPFLSEQTSTYEWPAPLTSDENIGTIEYAVAHPTTFITYTEDGGHTRDWSYIDDYTRWQSTKTQYDPCPPGWKVCDCADWQDAYDRNAEGKFSSSTQNWDFSGVFGSGSSIMYPSTNWKNGQTGEITIGTSGVYWSTTFDKTLYLKRDNNGINSLKFYALAQGFAVRCQKE